MNKMLFYISTIKGGGAARVMVNLANSFTQKGYEVLLVTNFHSANEYELDEAVKRLSLDEEEQKQNLIIKNIRSCIQLRHVLKAHQPDLVISFMGENNFRSLLSTSFTKIKTIISVRNDPKKEYRRPVDQIASKLLYPLADGTVFQTKDAQNYFPSKIQSKSRVILNQVDKKFYEIAPKKNKSGIISVGRLSKQKNQVLLIEAFARIANNIDDNLTIYGQGEMKDTLVALSKNLGIEDRVVFPGTVANIEEKIAESKLFVLSSDYEGLPNVLMEAMAVGVPVISTDCPCGGPRMLIDHEVNGVLVDVGDKMEMSKMIYKILSDENYATRLSVNAKKKALEFMPDVVLKEWEQYILDISREH